MQCGVSDMKDERDNQTSELFPAPRRRGRPSTGQAKTPAERMRAYRDRKRVGQVQSRKTVTVSSVTENSEIEQLRGRISALKDALVLSASRTYFLNSEIDRLKKCNGMKNGDLAGVLIDCLGGAYVDNVFNGGMPVETARTFVARLCGALDSRPEYEPVRDCRLKVFPHLAK
jgi:hypothetical protein